MSIVLLRRRWGRINPLEGLLCCCALLLPLLLLSLFDCCDNDGDGGVWEVLEDLDDEGQPKPARMLRLCMMGNPGKFRVVSDVT